MQKCNSDYKQVLKPVYKNDFAYGFKHCLQNARKVHYNNEVVALLLTNKNRALLSFCSSVQKKRDPSDATLCQDDIVRVRRFLKMKQKKEFYDI